MRVRINKLFRPVRVTRIEKPGQDRTARYARKESVADDPHPVKRHLTGILLNEKELAAESLAAGVRIGHPVRIDVSSNERLVTSPVRRLLLAPDGDSLVMVTASQNTYEISVSIAPSSRSIKRPSPS
jgi:antitoxin component of MazEF toxin-antitoxin module